MLESVLGRDYASRFSPRRPGDAIRVTLLERAGLCQVLNGVPIMQQLETQRFGPGNNVRIRLNIVSFDNMPLAQQLQHVLQIVAAHGQAFLISFSWIPIPRR